ncbi:MAG: aminotransferase class I/II-fold pyridoxal phosphate-dependent enzyme [Bryobacteraceae bacterium]|nr:aminotransferase class I/II-fold pyridoxal phosphate-dependent enzyme [Bryobacteraceae bacterium]
MADTKLDLQTRAVHAGRRIDPATGAVTPPIHLSTTFERSPAATYPLGFEYGRENNPNRQALEECLADLEGGAQALCFSSGMAAIHAVFQSLEPGDHLIVADEVYYGVRKLLGEVFAKSGLESTSVDLTDLAAVEAAIRPSTRLIWIETPSNPTLKITDLAAISALARPRNIMTACDSTFASPILQRPLDHGIDLVMHSTTKYVGGHSDLTGGALIGRHQSYLFERARKSQTYAGGVPSPFDCWLALRGVATLPLRVHTAASTALRLAHFLEAHPRVERVNYPGLPSHPGHAVAARQMSAFGGMLSFLVRGAKEDALAVAARTRIFTRATSLGGVHSFIEHRASIEGPTSRTPQNHLRLSIGIEHPGDLEADLAAALGA